MLTTGKPPAPLPHGHSHKQKRNALKPSDLSGFKDKTLRRHSSHSRLQTGSNSDKNCRETSRTNLERSNSLTQLQVIQARLTRSLSASNLLALSDPNLSVREAKPQRSYDSPATKFAKDKAEFTAYCQIYFHQLTEGCGDELCKNMFCNSSSVSLSLPQNVAAMFSSELAATREKFICKPNTAKAKIFPKAISQAVDKEPLPFLCGLFSTTPFRSLFLPCPMTPLNLFPHTKHTARSNSYNNINSTLVQAEENQNFENSVVSQFSRLAKKLTSSLGSLLTGSREESHTENTQSMEIPVRLSQPLQSSNSIKIPDVKQLFGPATFVPNDCTNRDELDAFEQTLAAEMSEEIKSSAEEFSLTHLTLEMTHHVIEDYRECSDPSFILNTLRTVFSLSESLNLSFLGNGISNCVVSRSEIKEFYRLLQKTKDSEKFMSTITNSIEILLSELTLSTEKVTSEDINQFLIFLELPVLFESGLAHKVCDVIYKLSDYVRKAIINEFAKYTEEEMMKLVKVSNCYGALPTILMHTSLVLKYF